jgi:TonB family protein
MNALWILAFIAVGIFPSPAAGQRYRSGSVEADLSGKYFKWLAEDVPNIFEGKETQRPAGWALNIRILKAVRGEGPVEPARPVTSSYLQYQLTATLKTELGLAEDLRQIRRTFNFQDVILLTEANFVWKKGEDGQEFQVFRVGDREYLALLTPCDAAASPKFRIEMFEQRETVRTSLLDTECLLPEKNTTVFGFEAAKGEAYFLALRIASLADVLTPTAGDKSKAMYEALERRADFYPDDPIRAMGFVKPPKLLTQVDPVYPQDALDAGIEGTVIIEATTDAFGRVYKIGVLRTIPMLDRAAVEAVRQWVFEPMIVNGKPRGAIFTISVPFALKDRTARPEVLTDTEPVRIGAGGVTPAPLKKVDPVYPEVARRSRIAGEVILEVLVDVAGRVRDVKVVRSVPALNLAARDALAKWTYEPVLIDGKPVSVVFPVTVNFFLDKETPVVGPSRIEAQESASKVAAAEAVAGEPVFSERSRANAGVALKPLKKLVHVEPRYPEIARQARVSGVVLLQAGTDIYGRVAAVKILKSIPLLDQAAVEAVRQWVYEPRIEDGLAREAMFVVPVVFALVDELPQAVASVLPLDDGHILKKKHGSDIPYPSDAAKNRVEGEVVLEVRVDESGKVTAVKPIVSNPAFDASALEAVSRWTFEPYIVAGRKNPQSVTVMVLVNFVPVKPPQTPARRK